jgi:hypothetical protein
MEDKKEARRMTRAVGDHQQMTFTPSPREDAQEAAGSSGGEAFSVSFNMTPVVAKVDKLEGVLGKLRKGLNQFKRTTKASGSIGGNKTIDSLPGDIRRAMQNIMNDTLQETLVELAWATPKDSWWLTSSWKHSQGRPNLTVEETPERGPYPRGQIYDFPEDIDFDEVVWTIPQFLQNTAEYASEQLVGPQLEDIAQRALSGSVFRAATDRHLSKL